MYIKTSFRFDGRVKKKESTIKKKERKKGKSIGIKIRKVP